MHCYLHIPFCRSKCPYCDFASVAGSEPLQRPYVEALLDEVVSLPAGPYDTIYVGGGTPTALPADLLERLMEGLRRHLRLAPGCEFTCEANPVTADLDRLEVLAAGGVNRLSLGVQSFADHRLRFLGRAHDADQARRALDLARRRFPHLSLDLMTGLPGDGTEALDHDLGVLPSTGVDHVSLYHLAYEEGTAFTQAVAAGGLRPLAEETSVALLVRAWDGLAALGFAQYETSNFAPPGRECWHNLAYWRQHDWQAAGAGAVSTVGRVRLQRPADPAVYIADRRSGAWRSWPAETLDATAWLREAWMLGLRLAEGVDEAGLARLADPPARWTPIARRLEGESLLERSAGRLRLTRAGRVVQDAVTVALMP